MKYGYQNGEIKEVKDIKISPYDLGFLRGYAVFDVSRTTKRGNIFLLKEHHDRILFSAKTLNINFNLSQDEFQKVVSELMDKNGVEQSIIRVIISGGEGVGGFTFNNNPTILILLEPWVLPENNIYENGVNIVTLEYNREYPGVKTTNYLQAIKNQEIKEANNAIEILYIKNDEVFECSTANIFIVKDKIIYTPESGILPGTTKKLVIKLIRENNLQIIEEKISRSEVFQADEVFITAANKNIMPVKQIDDKIISDGKVGVITKELIQIYNKFEDNY